MNKQELSAWKIENFDPILSRIVSIHVISRMKLRNRPAQEHVDHIVRPIIIRDINPTIIEFITDPDLTFKDRLNKNSRRVYSIEDKTRSKIRKMISEFYADKDFSRKKIREKTEDCCRMLEVIINKESIVELFHDVDVPADLKD